MKRIVTLLLALMLVLASIPAALADTAAPLVIEFWHTRGSGANYEVTKASVDEFNATIGKEKGIEVVEIYSGSYADIVTKLQLAAQTDSKPAVAGCADRIGVKRDHGGIADVDKPCERALQELAPEGGKENARQPSALMPHTFDHSVVQRRARRADRYYRQ